MRNRKIPFAVCVCLASSFAAYGQANQYLFQLPGPTSSSGSFVGFVATAANLTTPSISATGPIGLSHIIPVPNGAKFYLLGTVGANALQSADGNFTQSSFHSVNGLAATPNAAAVSPDGKFLVVSADALYIIDTTSDQILGTLPLPEFSTNTSLSQSQSCPACWITFSRDSKRVYVLTNSQAIGHVTAVDLTSRTKIGSLTLPAGNFSITMSPFDLLYVTATFRIYEIDSSKLVLTTGSDGIPVNAEPARLKFLPDGSAAFAVNYSPAIGGRSILQFNIADHSVTYWPSIATNSAPLFDDVLVAGPSRIFAIDSTSSDPTLTGLWDVQASPVSAGCPSCNLNGNSTLHSLIPTQNVLAIAVSNELPSARFLFALVNNGNQTNLDRIDLNANTVNNSVLAAVNSGILEFDSVPPQTGAAGFLQFNKTQTVNAGATSAPIFARVLDGTGRPVFNLGFTFSTDPTNGLVINTPTGITTADGYAVTTVSAPAASAACNTPVSGNCVYTITLTAGTTTSTFTLNVPTTGGGGGGGGGNSQVTIVSGDGQLVKEGFSTPITNPLTILVTDTSGKPLPNVPVLFSVTPLPNGLTGGGIDNTNVNTDQNGMAFTDFISFPIQSTSVFQGNTINASTPYGSVNFTVTSYHTNPDGSGFPESTLLTPGPSQNFTITVGQGTPVPNAIVAQILAGGLQSGTPIPNVGIYTLNALDATQPPPAKCVGSALSDQNGLAHCTLVAACQVGSFPLTVSIGTYNNFNLQLNVTSGSPSQINIKAGNNQTGNAGQTLPQALVATITDGCNTPVAGVNVTWTVTSGSATLLNTTATSNAQGQVFTSVKLGQTPGPVQVKVAIGTTAQQVFTLTNQVVVASIAATSGNNQTVITGQTFQPVTFAVKDINNNPVPGLLVTFTVTTGSATITPTSATTDLNGQVSVTVSAGVPAGPIVITASVAGLSATANLASRAPGPSITSGSFVNAASFMPGLVPCGLATVTGTGIAPGVQGELLPTSPIGPLPYALGPFSLTVNGIQAPIQSIFNEGGKEQANFQTPCEVQPGTATVAVTINGSTTTITGIQVFQGQPGIFTYQGANGKLYGVVIRAQDGSYVTPTNPAHRGDTLYLFATGLGQTTPPILTNNAGVAGEQVNLTVVVGVDNAGVNVLQGQTQSVVGIVGLYSVGFQIPATAPTGTDQPLALAVVINGQLVFGNSVLLAGVI